VTIRRRRRPARGPGGAACSPIRGWDPRRPAPRPCGRVFATPGASGRWHDPRRPPRRRRHRALLNHWIANTAITFTPTPKTAEDIADQIAAKAAAGHGFFVACEDGALLGQASYGQFRAGAGYATCMEHSISLCPRRPGPGPGPGAAAGGRGPRPAGGAHQMIAGVSGENPDGRAFHDRMGYRLVAIVPQAGFKFGRFMDLWLMQKFL
jgi:L-amino acid N-acyltransferase YncA